MSNISRSDVTNLNSDFFIALGGSSIPSAVTQDNKNNANGYALQMDSINYKPGQSDQQYVQDMATYLKPMLDLLNSHSLSQPQSHALEIEIKNILDKASDQTGDKNFGNEVLQDANGTGPSSASSPISGASIVSTGAMGKFGIANGNEVTEQTSSGLIKIGNTTDSNLNSELSAAGASQSQITAIDNYVATLPQ